MRSSFFWAVIDVWDSPSVPSWRVKLFKALEEGTGRLPQKQITLRNKAEEVRPRVLYCNSAHIKSELLDRPVNGGTALHNYKYYVPLSWQMFLYSECSWFPKSRFFMLCAWLVAWNTSMIQGPVVSPVPCFDCHNMSLLLAKKCCMWHV